MAEHDCDVLISGAGPVGVTLALLLAQKGVRVLIADKAASIYPLPRAAHIDHEIVRIFQGIGTAEDVLASSRIPTGYDFLNKDGEVLLRFDNTAIRSPSGWSPANMIHQPSIETALRARLDPAVLRTEWTLQNFSQSGEAVVAQFAAPSGTETIRAKYLVGCDGARSTVRELCRIGLHDLQFDEPWLVIDTIVQDPARLPDINLQICDPGRPTTCVLMGAGRHRWEFMMLPGETAEQVSAPAFIADLLRPWNVEGAVTLERSAVYRFHALVAKSWRQERIFLAGDAAHQTPPFAGQGLCAGIRDAANLAWKLAAVLRGEAGAELLDTYQIEREPHVRWYIDLALMMGRTVCITDPDAAAARDAAMLAQRAAGEAPSGPMAAPALAAGCIRAGSPGAGTYFPQPWSDSGTPARLDDVLGPTAVLISRSKTRAFSGLISFALSDSALHPFAADLTAWLDTHNAEAVLVRPDRYVFGTGNAEVLAQEWSAALSASDVSASDVGCNAVYGIAPALQADKFMSPLY